MIQSHSPFFRFTKLVILLTNLVVIFLWMRPAVGQTPSDSEAVSAYIDNVLFDSGLQTYQLSVSYTNPNNIQKVRVVLWNEKDGVQESEQEFLTPALHNNYIFSAGELTPGQDYSFRIYASDHRDQPILNSQSQTLLGLHKVRYNPEIVRLELGIASVAIDSNELILNLDVRNGEAVKTYSGWLVDEATNTQVPDSRFTLPVPSESSLRITLLYLPAGKYSIYLKALDENGLTLAESKYGSLAYLPPRPPSLFVKAATGLRGNPYLLWGIISIFLLLVIFMMLHSQIEKRRTGTPFLQSLLNSKVPKNNPINKTQVLIEDNVLAEQDPRQRTYAGGRPSAYLVVVKTGGSEKNTGKVKVVNIPFTIGREGCDLNLPDTRVSGRHARINWLSAANAYYITDLKSTNGVTLNGLRIPRERQTVLDPGTLIRLSGRSELLFQVEED
jgi:hypothetical protein